VRRLSGQAARHAGVLLHRLAAVVVAVAVLGGAAIGALGWRLAQGPLELPWLTKRVEAALNQEPTGGRISIGSAALAWEGFRLGVDRPVDIRLTAVTLTRALGTPTAGISGAETPIFAIPNAEISVSLHALLFGRITPRALELDQPRISLVRTTEGAIVVEPSTPAPDAGEPAGAPPGQTPSGSTPSGIAEPSRGPDVAAAAGPLIALLTELANPPANDNSPTRIGPFSQLRRLRIRGGSVVVADRQLGVTWQAPQVELDLTRGAKGGVAGTADVSLVLGDQHARLTASATLAPHKGPIRLRLRMTPVTPALIGGLAPRAAPLGALDAPVGGEADLQLDDTARLMELHLALRVGAGGIHVADGVLPITGATVVADATADHLDLRSLRLTVPGHPGGPDSVLRATGRFDRGADHLTASLGLDLDHVAFADLPRLWPAGVGRGARAWVTENITAGVAHDGHVEIELAATPDLSDVTLTRATGTLTGDGLVVHWLRPVPPIVDGSAVLNILDPDTLEIVVHSGHQQPEVATPGPQGVTQAGTQGRATQGLSLNGGRMRITGIMQHDQFGTIEAQIAGPLPDAIALLRNPRLQLLARHDLPLDRPAGQVAGTVTLSLPLEDRVTMDDVAIRAHAHLDGVHLSGGVAGRDLDQGVLDLDANVDGLTMTGTAALAGIPANLAASMDFRAGGPGQILQRISVSGHPTAHQLAAAGLDVGAMLDGTLGLDAALSERRDGAGDIAVTADLAPATVTLAALAWHKPAGAAMTASGRLLLSHDRLAGIDNILVRGDGVVAEGRVTCVDGKPSMVRFDRVVLGRSEARGTIRLPITEAGQANAAGPIAVSLTGPTLDLSARLTHRPGPHSPPAKHEPPSGPHWTLDASFDRVIMAGDHQLTGLVARVDSDGGLTRRLEVDGLTGPKAPFKLRIVPTPPTAQPGGAVQPAPAQSETQPGTRTVTATAANAGDLLAGLDVVTRMQGGRLHVTGTYDDTTPDHTLDGTGELTDFRIHDAPALARLLQAMTLYGLVDVVRGPGLGFTRLDVPFRLTETTLTLNDARAFNSSLGLTARGTIDLDLERAAIEGTIVPAYFFNSLLGNIPLLGRLFSPEPGGGLFAASYSLRGPLDNPEVSVNPLSALTPGFLRGVFGLF